MRNCILAFLCLLASCSAPSTLSTAEATATASTAESIARQSEAFQRDHDATMKSPTSPLTVVHARYLESGESLSLAIGADGALRVDPPTATIQFTMDGIFQCTLGCGPHPRAITRKATFSLGEGTRFSVIAANQSGKGRVLVHDAHITGHATYRGLNWFPVNPAMIVSARFTRHVPRPETQLMTNRGLAKTLYPAGTLEFTLGQQQHQLIVYAYVPEPTAGEALLIPFHDQTSGQETYGAGRYLELEHDIDAEVIKLDFNRATNPYCAYSPYYNCPMPTRANRLPVAIRAGERTYADH